MTLLDGLDVFLGLVSIFLVLSLLVSSLGEGYGSVTRLRGRKLRQVLSHLLGIRDAEEFAEHPDIQQLFGPKNAFLAWIPRRFPSYIPDRIFSSALLDFIVNTDRVERELDPTTSSSLDPEVLDAAIRESGRSYTPKLVELWESSARDVQLFQNRIAEWYVSGTAERTGGALWRGIVGLLGTEDATRLVKHPRIADLHGPRPSLLKFLPRAFPKQIPAVDFTRALVAVLVNRHRRRAMASLPLNPATIDRSLRESRRTCRDNLARMWVDADFEAGKFQGRIRQWFNDTADRSTGWFRRELGAALFIMGSFVAFAINADTIHMVQALSRNPEAREVLVEFATTMSEADVEATGDARALEVRRAACVTNGLQPDCTTEELAKAFSAEMLPIAGWDDASIREFRAEQACFFLGSGCTDRLDALWMLLGRLLGWLLTGVAVSLGAPFWFDLLQKLVKVRSSMKSENAEVASANATPSASTGEARAPQARMRVRAADSDAQSLETLDGFAHRRYGFERINLYWCARMSRLAYADEGEATGVLESWGAEGCLIDATACKPDHLDDDVADTQVLVAVTPTAAILAFRGSETKLSDWLTNSDVHYCDKSEEIFGLDMHRGFSAALQCVWPTLLEKMASFGVFDRGLPIWVTGHSLGGALATVAGYRLSKELPQRERPTSSVIGGVMTYGQPRVGGPNFADAVDRALPNRYFRVVNNRDGVPRVPFEITPDIRQAFEGRVPDILQYQHAGRVIYFTDLGRAIADPPNWYRHLDSMALATSVSAIREKLAEAAGDHSMGEYIRLLAGLLNTGPGSEKA